MSNLTLPLTLEEYIVEALTSAQEKQHSSFFNGFRKVLKALPEPRILLCSVKIRRSLFGLLFRQFPEIHVLSYHEIHENHRIRETCRLSRDMIFQDQSED